MKTNKMLPDSSISKVWENFRKMNGIVLTIPSSSWIESEEGFTNTVYYDGFTADEILEIDLYNDGNLTETQINEYDNYITEFNILNGMMVAAAASKPTVDITVLCRGELVGEKVIAGSGTGVSNALAIKCKDADGNDSNVQAVLDEQNKNSEWKLVGSAVGRNYISLPNNFNELFVDLCFDENGESFMGCVIPEIAITETELVRLLPGGYWNTSGRWAAISISKSNVKLCDFISNTKDKSSECTLLVYYR